MRTQETNQPQAGADQPRGLREYRLASGALAYLTKAFPMSQRKEAW
jgi:hypothetical protein